MTKHNAKTERIKHRYGEVANQRQGEIIKTLNQSDSTPTSEVIQLAKALANEMRKSEKEENE